MAFSQAFFAAAGLAFLLAACDQPKAPPIRAKLKLSSNPVEKTPVSDTIEGNQETNGPAYIQGWVWDKSYPSARIRLKIQAGDKLLGIAVADRFRKDLLKAGIGDGRHGFKYRVPDELKDGKTHMIYVTVSGAEMLLPGSGKPLAHGEGMGKAD